MLNRQKSAFGGLPTAHVWLMCDSSTANPQIPSLLGSTETSLTVHRYNSQALLHNFRAFINKTWVFLYNSWGFLYKPWAFLYNSIHFLHNSSPSNPLTLSLFIFFTKKRSQKHHKPLGSGIIKPLLCTRLEKGTTPVKQRPSGVFELTERVLFNCRDDLHGRLKPFKKASRN